MKQVKWLAIILVTASLFIGTAVVFANANKVTVIPYVAPPQQTEPLKADTIFTLVNAERTKAGLKPLVKDTRLTQTAQERADDMDARNYYSHYDPVTGEKMIAKQTAQCVFSENINGVYSSSVDKNADIVTGWMGSKSHREAILNESYTLTGVAISGSIAVQHFC